MSSAAPSSIRDLPLEGSPSIASLLRLDGKVALVTGGSRGLGLQMAEALAEFGAHVVLTARKEADLQQAEDRIRRAGGTVSTFTANLSDTDAISGLVANIVDRVGPVDILVNNAGTTWGAPAEEQTPEQWLKVISLNLNTPFLLSQAVANASFIPRRSGRIINVASIMAFFAPHPETPPTVGYNASKAALVGLTRSLAAEWGKYGININAIAPGYFPSKMTRQVLDSFEEAAVRMTPVGRLGGEADLKGITLLLASEAGRHITGQTVIVDGGASLY